MQSNRMTEEKESKMELTHSSGSVAKSLRFVPLHAHLLPCGLFVVSEYDSHHCTVIDSVTRKVIRTFPTSSLISSLGVLEDEKIVVGHLNKPPEIYHVTAEKNPKLSCRFYPKTKYTILPDGSILQRFSDYMLWHSHPNVAGVKIPMTSIMEEIYSPVLLTNTILLGFTKSGTMYIWNLQDGSQIGEVALSFKKFNVKKIIAAVLPNGYILVTLKLSNQLMLFQFNENRDPILLVEYPPLLSIEPITSIAAWADEKKFVIGDCRGNIQIWDVYARKCIGKQQTCSALFELLCVDKDTLVYLTSFGSVMGSVKLKSIAKGYVERESVSQRGLFAASSLQEESVQTDVSPSIFSACVIV